MSMRGFAAMAGAAALVALFAPASPALAHDEQGGAQGGAAAEQLDGFQHVFNFNPNESDVAQGTDLDFWTAEVPLRDYTTGQFIDEQGNPLPEFDPDGNPTDPIIAPRDFAVVGSYNVGAFIFDITNPEDTQVVSKVPCQQVRNDPAVKRFTDADGNTLWLLALAKDNFEDGNSQGICIRTPRFGQNHGAGITVFDVTDPFTWSPMYSVQFPGGAHNFTFHPTQPFGWASNGDLPGALPPPSLGFDLIPIIDFTDPRNPQVGQIDIPAGSPHDLEFSRDGTRAYVAAENHYEIYDTTDPADPELLGATPNIGSYAHGAFPTPDKKIMITNNESLVIGGFITPGACPGEGLGFYNVEGVNEAAPLFLGYYVPREPAVNPGFCTSHFGKVADNNHVITIAWYVLGARVVDFTNPSLPTEVGAAVMENSNVWSAKFYKGPYMYTGDFNRGFDVFKWTGDGPAPWEAP